MALVENPAEVTECGGEKWPSGSLFAEAADALLAKSFTALEQTAAFLGMRAVLDFSRLLLFTNRPSKLHTESPALFGWKAWPALLQLPLHLTHHMLNMHHLLSATFE